MYDQEIKGAEDAAKLISRLSPSPHSLSDEEKVILREASRLATDASIPGFSSQSHLDKARAEAVIALNGLCGETVEREMIDRAKKAVQVWVDNLKKFVR
jgi:hypothetical protein